MFYVFERLRIIASLLKKKLKIIDMAGGDQGDDI